MFFEKQNLNFLKSYINKKAEGGEKMNRRFPSCLMAIAAVVVLFTNITSAEERIIYTGYPGIAGMVTIEFPVDSLGFVFVRQKIRDKTMFFTVPKDAFCGDIFLGEHYAGAFCPKDNKLVGRTNAINYEPGDDSVLYRVAGWDVVAFLASDKIAIKAYKTPDESDWLLSDFRLLRH